MPEKYWVIINVEGVADQFGYLFENDMPLCLLDSYDAAAECLLEAQKREPHKTYVLFEGLAYARECETDGSIYFVEPVE